jgi:hypothetical protein
VQIKAEARNELDRHLPNPSPGGCPVNAAQNARRWSVSQHRKASAAMTVSMERERIEKLAGLRTALADMEKVDSPMARQLAASMRDQIAALET